MKKEQFTHKQLYKRIGSYSALAAAFMSTATTVSADAVYTDVDPDAVVLTGEAYDIDFDGDGANDFQIFASTFFGSNYIAVNPLGNGRFVGTSFYNVYNLAAGDVVNAAGPFGGTGFAGALWSDYVPGNHPPGGGPSFVGVTFDIMGPVHYGWIEVDVITSGEVHILSHGYNDTPDTESIVGAGAVVPPTMGGTGVPTMSEWGLITFALMMLSFGTIAIGRKKRIMPDGTTVDMGVAHEFRNPPFNATYFKKAIMLTLGLIGLATTGTLLAYGSIALVDVVGFSIAAPIFAYLSHLTMLHNAEWKKNK